MKEKTISSTLIYDGKIIRVEKDVIELENGHQSTREVVFNSGGVCVLALTKDNQVIFVKQFRYPSKEVLYEIPGGKQNPNESYIESGMRELEEESGYTSTQVEYLGCFYPTVAYATEVIHMLVATDCVFTHQHLDEGEHVEVVLMDYKKALDMVMNGEIKDGKTIVALLKYNALMRRKRK